MRFEKAFKIVNGCFSHPSHETVTHVLRHALVFLKLFQKDLSVESQDLLKVAENRLGLAPGTNKKNSCKCYAVLKWFCH